jgi:epoxyqueuosine reductase QueG
MTLDLCNFIVAAANAYAVPVPSYAPMKFHGMEPWGLLSLKHAAVNAGLGAIGRNGLMHHPAFGTMLRLGAVVTDVPLPESDLQDSFPCPEKCRACHQACPPGAFNDAGQFAKLTCMGQTIKHAIYPLALKDEHGLKHLERIINTAGHNYWLTCNACLSVCPNNRKKAE